MFVSKQAALFIEMEAARAKRAGIACDFPPKSHVPHPITGEDVDGYFIDTPYPKFAIAVGKPADIWLPAALHESCHMDQFLEQSPYWDDRLVPGSRIEAREILMLWVQGKIELSRDQRKDYLARVRSLELDCERRVVKKIREGNLPISATDYIKKANSYLFFFTAMEYLQRWYLPEREPFNVMEVWKHAPDNFLPEDEYGCFGCIPKNLFASYYSITMTCCGEE